MRREYWVYHLSEDPQGGYWPVSPKGPYETLPEARRARRNLIYPISHFTGRRQSEPSSRVRDVHIRMRWEIRLPQWVQKLNTPHEKKEN